MNKLINTSFETALRILLLLSSDNGFAMSIDQITVCDFMTIYSRNFGLSYYNLHGENPFFFSEYTLKRKRIAESIELLVQNGYIQTNYESAGILYSLTESGLVAAQSLSSIYAEEYASLAQKTLEHCHGKPEAELLKELYTAMIQFLRR